MATPWTLSDPTWAGLTDAQKAAAMSLMEAGTNNVDDARNAAGAMVNRSSLTGTPLGKHVSGAIYQPTIEPSQHSRLAKILSSPQFSEMTDWVSQRQAGSVPDPVNGATHFLAHPNVMLSLERQNPSKYKNWGPRGANWTGYDQNTGQYSGQVFADKSHAFLIPKEMQARGAKPSGEYGGEMTAAANAPDPAAAIEATKARRAALAMAMAQPSAAANGNGVSVIAPPAASAASADLTPPDPARAALAKALIEGALSSRSNTWQGAIGDLLSMYAGTRGQAATHADEKAYNAKLADAIQAGGNDPEALKAIMARIAPAKALEMAMSPKAHEWSVTPEGVMFDKHTGPASATQVGEAGAKTAAEIEKLRSEAEKNRRPEGANFDALKISESLRKEYSDLSKEYRMIKDSYDRVKAGAADDTGAGDIAVVYGYMKALDPTSVVREGEFANAENSAGIPEKVRAMYNKSITGERLTPDQRKNFVGMSGKLLMSKRNEHSKIKAQFTEQAKRHGLNPDDIITDFGDAAAPPPAAAPAIHGSVAETPQNSMAASDPSAPPPQPLPQDNESIVAKTPSGVSAPQTMARPAQAAVSAPPTQQLQPVPNESIVAKTTSMARPAGWDDLSLLLAAKKKIAAGADKNAVGQQLTDWGVKW